MNYQLYNGLYKMEMISRTQVAKRSVENNGSGAKIRNEAQWNSQALKIKSDNKQFPLKFTTSAALCIQ